MADGDSSKDIETRQLHSPGHTVLAFTHDGSALITAGADGLVNIIQYGDDPANDQENFAIKRHDSGVCSIATYGNKFMTAGEDGVVAIFDAYTVKCDKTVFQSDASVRAAVFDASGLTISLASDDTNVRVLDIRYPENITVLEGHTRCPTSLCFSPNGSYLVSCADDGDIRIWQRNAKSGQFEGFRVLKGYLQYSNSSEPFLQTISWHPDGNSFAIPGTDNNVMVISAVSWQVQMSLAGAHDKSVTSVAWSPNGKYIASVALDRRLIIWEMAGKREPMLHYNHPTTITGIAWHPTGNAICLTDSLGQLLTWDNCIQILNPTLNHPAEGATTAFKPDLERFLAEDALHEGKAVIVEDIVMTTEAVEDIDLQSLEHRPPQDVPTVHLSNLQSNYKLGKQKGRHLSLTYYGCVGLNADTAATTLYWKRQDTGGTYNLKSNIIGGALGETAVVFVAQIIDDNSRQFAQNVSLNTPPTLFSEFIYCVPQQEGQKPWSICLPQSERIEYLAVGANFFLVATNLGFVRCFGIGGAEVLVISLPNVHAMEARDGLALIVYGGGKDFVLLDCHSLSIIRQSHFTVADDRDLAWIHISRCGYPVICDTTGLICNYVPNGDSGLLYPVMTPEAMSQLPTTQTKGTWWPIDVNEHHIRFAQQMEDEQWTAGPTREIHIHEINIAIPKWTTLAEPDCPLLARMGKTLAMKDPWCIGRQEDHRRALSRLLSMDVRDSEFSSAAQDYMSTIAKDAEVVPDQPDLPPAKKSKR